jgi:Lon-like protease
LTTPASSPPPATPTETPASAWVPPPRKRVSRWWWALLAVVVLLFAGAFAGFWVRLPYYTISPGGEVAINPRITVNGAREYTPKGEVLLLFVRERARVNVWRYVQARLDPDIDLFPEQEFTSGRSPEELKTEAQADMANSQIAAKKVALEAIGYDVPPATEGVVVLATLSDTPAARVLERGDIILSVDGKPIRELDDLSNEISKRKPGERVTLRVRQGDQEHDVTLRTTRNREGRTIIGVSVTQRYDFPIDVEIDTSDIGGPSAGLAMTLAIIDDLTPGELTGGKEVAVTGTIATDGHVGEIGGIEQKAVAAKSGGAELFIVPKCTEPTLRTECQRDLDRARKRAGDTPVVAVANLDEALRALRQAGGEPVEPVANAA